MAILVQQKPAEKSLVYNDNIWIFGSTIGTLTNFRYHVKVLQYPITIPATIHHEDYIYPRQEAQGLTYFDPSRILESLLSHDVSIPDADHNGFIANDNSHTEYYLVITEQQRNASNVWVNVSPHLSVDRVVWNGGIRKRDWLTFDYSDYEMEVGVTDTKFLTSGPTTRYQNSADSSWLYFTAKEDDAPRYLQVKSYDAAGSILSTETIENPNDTAISENPFTGRKYQFARVVTGREDLNATDAAYKSAANIVDPSAVYYTVQLRSSHGILSELYTYWMDQKCSKFDTIRLHWLNEFGGFDSYNFILKHTLDTDIDRRSYHQEHHTWGAAGTFDYGTDSRGKTDYSVEMADRIRINSDYMDETDAAWMQSLIESPVVFQEIGSDLVAVNIKASTYTKKTTINDKLKQYEIDLEYSLKENRQRG